MKAEKMHAFNKENRVRQFWKFFSSFDRNLFQIMRIDTKAMGRVIMAVKVCLQGMVNKAHSLSKYRFASYIVFLLSSIQAADISQKLFPDAQVFFKLMEIGIKLRSKSLA